ncbi:hypothetical protein [Rhizobium sp. BK251]|uniref:hypothetical protein n=1 Tax=Rhizobium sp. BK251 TaxID=2512125 RepID=UPI001FDFDB44|nr:hypothetical protein [Rhizobium sp. BK251]
MTTSAKTALTYAKFGREVVDHAPAPANGIVQATKDELHSRGRWLLCPGAVDCTKHQVDPFIVAAGFGYPVLELGRKAWRDIPERHRPTDDVGKGQPEPLPGPAWREPHTEQAAAGRDIRKSGCPVGSDDAKLPAGPDEIAAAVRNDGDSSLDLIR